MRCQSLWIGVHKTEMKYPAFEPDRLAVSLRVGAIGLVLAGVVLPLGGCGGALTQSGAGRNSQYAGNGALDRTLPANATSPTPAATTSPTPVATSASTPASTPRPVEPVAVTLATDKSSYRRGEVVKLSITATSTKDEPQTLEFANGQRFDVTATPEPQTEDARNEVVWRWSHDRSFTEALGSETFSTGEPKTWTATWDQQDNEGKPVARGRYVLQVKITSKDGISAAPVTVELTD